MSLNQELIRTRCEEIFDCLERLEKIKESAREEFIVNRDLQDIASYRLLVAIEAALNLCFHVSAKKLKKAPGEYAECFGLLGDAGIIPGELAGELKKMARFRNMLVHRYWKIDYEILFEILHVNLDDLRCFTGIIAGLA
ncbi:MAG: DUF86 domain-containing protein [Candidatus Aminicenantes bacterium]|nr:DUF86 domain-containing protein [Candidatus Aminicenantes bacterium]